MHAALFAEPSEWDTTEDAAIEAFGRYAQENELDLASFESCMGERRYRPNVERNQAEGQHLGITGTPAFIINGKLLAGAHPYTVFKNAFERELQSLR